MRGPYAKTWDTQSGPTVKGPKPGDTHVVVRATAENPEYEAGAVRYSDLIRPGVPLVDYLPREAFLEIDDGEAVLSYIDGSNPLDDIPALLAQARRRVDKNFDLTDGGLVGELCTGALLLKLADLLEERA